MAMRYVTSGQLRERVTFERKTVTRNTFGEEVQSWAPIGAAPASWPVQSGLHPMVSGGAASVWARVEPLAGRERLMAQQMGATADVRVTVRYRPDVNSADRLMWRGQPFDIVSASDVDARRQWLEIMCVSGARDGR